MTTGLRVYVIAGEPSGDLLGGHLLASLSAMASPLEIHGVGGPAMAEQGLTSRFEMRELSVMGLAEVLPRLPGLLRRIDETARDVVARRPDMLITIDSPDFCLRVARKARALMPSLPVVHYVAPSVWAWRPGRAAKMARAVDHVLALLPFEPPYMTAAGMSCDFVGHPAARLPVIGVDEAAAFRDGHGIAPDAAVLCVLPGSRRGEAARHGPVFADCLTRLCAERPGLRVVIPVAGAVEEAVREQFSGHASSPVILSPHGPEAERRKHAAFAAADAALAASGTVSLELARQGTPMVIGYRMNALTQMIVRRMFRASSATLVNLVTGTGAVPEFFFERCTPENLVPAVLELLDQGAGAAAQRIAMADAMAALSAGPGAPGDAAARSVLEFLHRHRTAIG